MAIIVETPTALPQHFGILPPEDARMLRQKAFLGPQPWAKFLRRSPTTSPDLVGVMTKDKAARAIAILKKRFPEISKEKSELAAVLTGGY